MWARSATKHRIKRHRSRFVIERCGLIFRVPSIGVVPDDRLVFLGTTRVGDRLK